MDFKVLKRKEDLLDYKNIDCKKGLKYAFFQIG